MYLIYSTEQDAWDRSEQEGIAQGLAHHTTGSGSRYVTAPQETADDKWALPVSGYALSEEEEAATVPSYEPKPIPEEM